MVLQLVLMLQQCWQAFRRCDLFGVLHSLLNRSRPGVPVPARGGRCEKEVAIAEKVPAKPPKLLSEWDAAGVQSVEVVVRAVSGNVLYSQEGVTPSTQVNKLIRDICETTESECKVVQLCAGTEILKQGFQVGDCIVPPNEGTLELTLLKLPGPPLEVSSLSGLQIEIAESFPVEGDRCHFDRNYKFLSLGDFAKRPGIRYIKTSNADKFTPSDQVMWVLTLRVPATVYLNFRSDRHVSQTGARTWLAEESWERSKVKSTVSSGVPNGPYQGPVYSKYFDPGEVKLMGSNCEEGTYFVFVEAEALV